MVTARVATVISHVLAGSDVLSSVLFVQVQTKSQALSGASK